MTILPHRKSLKNIRRIGKSILLYLLLFILFFLSIGPAASNANKLSQNAVTQTTESVTTSSENVKIDK